MDNTKPVIHAFIATFLALGNAMGGRTLQCARDHLRGLIADDILGPDATDILEGVIAAIDYEDSTPEYQQWPAIQMRWRELDRTEYATH